LLSSFSGNERERTMYHTRMFSFYFELSE